MSTAAEPPPRLLGRYSYPTSHRVLELVSMATFVLLMGLLLPEVVGVIADRWGVGTALGLLLAAGAGFVAADVASGLVHGLCDNLGSVDTPIVGQKFIRSFREHHTDPLDMTRGDFVRVNADNFFVSLVVLVPTVAWLDVSAHPYLGSFVVALLLVVILTNQIHKWAHMAEVPTLVRWLQRTPLVLSPEHHAIHHAPPYDTHYCITSGITNGALARLGFWPVLLASCRRLGRLLPGSPAITGDQGPDPAPHT